MLKMDSVLRLILTALLLFFLNNLWAQNEIIVSESLYGEAYTQPMSYEGSPYLNDNWSQSAVYLKNGKTASNVKVKFNILSNDLIFYNDTLKRLFKVDKNTVNGFSIFAGKMDTLNYIVYQGQSVNFKLQQFDFVEVLQDGKIALWAKHTAEISPSDQLKTRDRIYPKNHYFLSTDEGIFEIKLRISSIIKTLPQYRQQIKKLAKDHQIKKKSEKNMALIISLLNDELK